LGVDEHRAVVVSAVVDEFESGARNLLIIEEEGLVLSAPPLKRRERGRKKRTLNPSTTMSFLSFTLAGIERFFSPETTSSAFVRRSNSRRGTKTQ
jgi:hypothetical protein